MIFIIILNGYNTLFLLVSLFIRAPDLGFLKRLYSQARFFVFNPARKIRDTNIFFSLMTRGFLKVDFFLKIKSLLFLENICLIYLPEITWKVCKLESLQPLIIPPNC